MIGLAHATATELLANGYAGHMLRASAPQFPIKHAKEPGLGPGGGARGLQGDFFIYAAMVYDGDTNAKRKELHVTATPGNTGTAAASAGVRDTAKTVATDSGATAGLESLFAALGPIGNADGPAPARPVEKWNPDFCGDIDMRISADGTWFYMGTPIGRPALVKLFASILRKDPERHVLVTPVERVGIQVDDAPFIAVEMAAKGDGDARSISFRTNVDDVVSVGPDNPLRFERDGEGGLKPYVRVRGDLWALVKRALMYDLVELGEERPAPDGGVAEFGVASQGAFFAMARADELAV